MSGLEEHYLVFNRDLYGNRVVARLKNGGSLKFCWNLTEEQADLVIQRLLEPQTKEHGQTPDKLSYPKGMLGECLATQKLKY